MENHFYSFYKFTNGSLRFKGVFSMEYFNDEIENGLVVFKHNEIETAKADFLVEKNRVVKNGKTWNNNPFIKKLIKKYCFVKS